MAGLVTLTAKAMTLQGFQLNTSDDMFTALKYLTGLGYTGTVGSSSQTAGAPVWQLWLNHPASSSAQMASLTDWIVLQNNSLAKVMSASQLTAMYTSP